MPSIGAPELLVIIVLALIIFGPRRLPEIGRTVGKSMREFRRAASQLRAEIEMDIDEEQPPRARGAQARGRPARKPAAARNRAKPPGETGPTPAPSGDGDTTGA